MDVLGKLEEVGVPLEEVEVLVVGLDKPEEVPPAVALLEEVAEHLEEVVKVEVAPPVASSEEAVEVVAAPATEVYKLEQSEPPAPPPRPYSQLYYDLLYSSSLYTSTFPFYDDLCPFSSSLSFCDEHEPFFLSLRTVLIRSTRQE